jgi:transcriptional regulator with XRE-family HTH domain
MREQGVSEKELAKDMGVSISTINRWRNNLTQPRPMEARALAARLKTDQRWLMGETENPDEQIHDSPIDQRQGSSIVREEIPSTMSQPFLPPPNSAERALILATKKMDAAHTADFLREILMDQESRPDERGRHARRVLNILAEKIQREFPDDGRYRS